MKKIQTLALIGTIGAIAFTGCSKNTTTPASPTGGSSSTTTVQENMSAKIDGVAFSRDTCRFYFQNANDTTNALIFDWPSFPPSGPDYTPLIEMSIEDYQGVGTYSLTSGKNFAELLNDKSTGGVNSYASGGSVTITSIYPYVVGTFHFATAGGIGVTDGNFTAKRY